MLTKDIEGTTRFDLTYTYDVAGRLIKLEETNSGSPRPLKEFYYARSNTGTNLRAGKLVMTKRHNWVDILEPLPNAVSGSLDALITEVFKYEGLDGQPSARQTRYTFNGAVYAFNMSQTYDALGNVATLTYPQCIHGKGDCDTAAPARTVSKSYTKGFLSSVTGYAPKIAYQSGGMLHQIEHANGVKYTMEINPSNGLERPHRIKTENAGGVPLWDTGIYSYDGAANISKIGTQKFAYDRRHRLVSGQVLVGNSLRNQTVTFDVYGNITSLTTHGTTLSTPTDVTSNRLQGPLAQYDGAGNLTSLDYGSEEYAYDYDAVNMMKHLRSNNDISRIYLYNADDERIAQFECVQEVCDMNEATETWTLRGLDHKVLRTYEHPWGEGWKWEGDYVFANSQTLARVNADGVVHVHPDHLGSTRQVTSSNGVPAALHQYYPFGQEASNSNQDDLRLKFSGHERDLVSSSAKGTLDYMHARHCSPYISRFLAMDPSGFSELDRPQTWNRYAYATNNPLRYVDPDGRYHGDFRTEQQKQIAKESSEKIFSLLIGVALLAAPGPEDMLLAYAIPAKIAKMTGKLSSKLRGRGRLQRMANEIRGGGLHPASRNQRTIAVGQDGGRQLHAASSNGFDAGQRAAADRLGVNRVRHRRGEHAEEDLLREIPDLKRVGTSKRAPCGPSEKNCAQQLKDAGVEVDNVE